MSTASPNLPDSAVGDPFLESLAAGVRAMAASGFPIIAAISGGADSVAMLEGLMALGMPKLVVAHAEHDLRAEAAADREFVEELAQRHGVPFTWRRLAVRQRGDEAAGEGLEARARRLRYDFLAEVAQETGGRHVLIAHTADDQAETILHRAFRGTGVAGLVGMRHARDLCEGVALVRPLLEIPRAAGRAFLRQRSMEWREDATNTDTTRARGFLRHEILPRCVAGPYPAAVPSLVRLAKQAATVSQALSSAAEHLLELYGTKHVDGTMVLKTKPLASLDRHLLAELFVVLWRRQGWPQRDMTASHYQDLAIRVLSQQEQPSSCLPGGVTVTTSRDDAVLVIARR